MADSGADRRCGTFIRHARSPSVWRQSLLSGLWGDNQRTADFVDYCVNVWSGASSAPDAIGIRWLR
jgi:hypothetical protein